MIKTIRNLENNNYNFFIITDHQNKIILIKLIVHFVLKRKNQLTQRSFLKHRGLYLFLIVNYKVKTVTILLN